MSSTARKIKLDSFSEAVQSFLFVGNEYVTLALGQTQFRAVIMTSSMFDCPVTYYLHLYQELKAFRTNRNFLIVIVLTMSRSYRKCCESFLRKSLNIKLTPITWRGDK